MGNGPPQHTYLTLTAIDDTTKFTKARWASQCGNPFDKPVDRNNPRDWDSSIPNETRNSFRTKPRETPYQLFLVRSSPFFIRRLPLQSQRPIGPALPVNQGDRPSSLCILGTVAGIVLFQSFRNA